MRVFLTKPMFIVTVTALILALTACSPRTLMVREFVNMVDEGTAAIDQEDDLHLLAYSMPSQIKLLETLLVGDPKNEKLLLLLARLYGGYAFAILETELEAHHLDIPSAVVSGIAKEGLADAVARYYEAGAQYALRGLECRYPDVRTRLKQVASAGELIQSLKKADVPDLFWYGFNLGGVVRHRLDSVEVLAKAHLVETAMLRVVELNEAYYHGNAHLALLVYHAARSPMMGGNTEKARKHFQRHSELNAGVKGLGGVYWSRYVLVRQQEKDRFVQHLSAVAQYRKDGGEASLLDKVAAVRAQLYLDSTDQFFD